MNTVQETAVALVIAPMMGYFPVQPGNLVEPAPIGNYIQIKTEGQAVRSISIPAEVDFGAELYIRLKMGEPQLRDFRAPEDGAL